MVACRYKGLQISYNLLNLPQRVWKTGDASAEMLIDYTYGGSKLRTQTTTEDINPSVKGVGTVFATHNGFVTDKGKDFWYDSKGRENVRVNLRNSYKFEWEKINDWYFLDITVNR